MIFYTEIDFMIYIKKESEGFQKVLFLLSTAAGGRVGCCLPGFSYMLLIKYRRGMLNGGIFRSCFSVAPSTWTFF